MRRYRLERWKYLKKRKKQRRSCLEEKKLVLHVWWRREERERTLAKNDKNYSSFNQNVNHQKLLGSILGWDASSIHVGGNPKIQIPNNRDGQWNKTVKTAEQKEKRGELNKPERHEETGETGETADQLMEHRWGAIRPENRQREEVERETWQMRI